MDNDVTVWFEIDGNWVDVTRLSDRARALIGDGEPGVMLRSGDASMPPNTAPRMIEFAYLDTDALFDPENYASPYYRKVGPGTPVRVQCDGVTQQVGEIAPGSPTVSWDDGAQHADGDRAAVAHFVCTDVVGRMRENDPPLVSALTRFYRDAAANPAYELLHWWAFEDADSATRIESAVGGRPMTGVVNGVGGDSGPLGAARALQQVYESRPAPLDDRSTNLQVVDLVPHLAPRVGEDWTLEVGGKFPATAVDDDTAPSLLVEWRTHGTPGYWQIRADYTTKCFELHYFNTPGQQFTITTDVVARDGEWHLVRIEVEHDSPDYTAYITIDGELVTSGLGVDVVSSPPKSAYIYNFEDVDQSIRPAISHLTMWAGTSTGGAVPLATDAYAAFLGHAGETVDARFARLAVENGYSYTSQFVEAAGGDLELGAQGQDPLSRIFDVSAETDASWWFSSRTVPNTIHRFPTDALYNRFPTFSASYAHLVPSFRPVPNDSIANVINASAERGAGEAVDVEFRIPDGDPLHWTTQAPPDGAYARPDSLRANLQEPAALRDAAAWRAHMRAWREKRYTQLTYWLERDVFTADDITAVRSLDIGHMIAQGTVGAPAWVPYTQVRGLVRGWTRVLGKQIDRWTIATVPADIWEVEVTDTSGSTLVAAIDDDDTSALVATSEGPEWSGFTSQVQIDGDPCGVSNVITPARSFIAAGAMASADNATVNPALPAGMTPDIGQSLYCFAASRGTGATVGTPAGWTAIDLGFTHVKLFHRYYVTGDGAPAVTVSAGAAGDTLSAICFAFSGTSPHLDETGGVGGVWSSTNASAQNITFPAAPVRTSLSRGLREYDVVHLLLGWKADDWTSVAPPASYTEMFDSSTTTGNDQGLWGAYRDTSSPTAFAGGAVTVTGGASAVSKGFVVAVRPLQEMTLVRGIDGTPTAHAAGVEVHAWHMGVTAL